MSNKSSGERLPSSPSHHKSAKTGGAKSSSKPSGSDQNENSSNSPSPPVVVLNEFLAETYENLFNFKNESLFTDVQIYVDGVEFPCHKVILCAASSYFRAMFTCDLKEARHGKVYIENISPWTMKRLLDFIYTGRIEISPDNVIDLFNAALLFQLHALVDKCTAYIQANIDLANCVEVNLFASMHQLASLEACSFKFMLENFMHLVHLSLSGGSSTTSSSSSSSSTSSSHHHHHHKAHHPANTPTSLMNALLNDQSASAAASKSASTAACSPPSSPSAFSSHSTSSAAANNELSLSDNLYSSFVRLSEQTFSELLKSDHLNVTREIYAYYSLVKWLDYNTELGKSTTSELHERLFANLRLNALNRDELEFIVKHDKYVRANAPLHATLKRHVYHNGQANSQPVLAQQQQPQQQQQPTVTTPQQTAQQLQQIQSQTSSLCVEDEARSNSGGVNSSGIGSSIIREVSSSAISSLARPSTIPRDYLCHLTGDRFEVYDFYKSKWSTLSPWPPSPPTTSPKKPHLNGGYSTCCLNNNLYVIGGYIRPSSSLNSSGNSTNNNDLFASASSSAFDSSMSPPLEPVDWLYKYDPIANEWSLLKPMLRPRAFHLSLCLCTTSNGGTPTTTSSHKENFILLFYGITSDYTLTDNVRERSWSGSSSESTSNPSTTANATSTAATNRAWSPRLVQCLSIDLYNVQTDQWSELKISDNSLLNHHIFHLYYQYNRAQLMTLSSSNTAAAVAAASSSIPSLIALIRLQLVQSRSICALKNLIYIVNEDCIHCYQLKDDSLACLPYFRLPFNLNQFILGGAVSASLNDSTTTTTSTGTTSANEVVSLFSWFSDSDEPVGSISSSSSESPTNEFDSGAIGAAAAASASDDNATTSTAATTSTFDRRLRLKKEKEAVIYLINPTKSLVYEFYPAKNKLKKLPTLLLRHHNSEASIININSKLYVTGGYLTKNDENSHHVLAAAASSSSDNEESDESSTSSDGSAIEVYDVTSNAWSIFMSKLSTPMIGDDDEDDLFGQLPVIRKFFKLKISIA